MLWHLARSRGFVGRLKTTSEMTFLTLRLKLRIMTTMMLIKCCLMIGYGLIQIEGGNPTLIQIQNRFQNLNFEISKSSSGKSANGGGIAMW